MADYYTPTVVQPAIPEADMTALECLLLQGIFSWEHVGDDIYFYAAEGTDDRPVFLLDEVKDALDRGEDTESATVNMVRKEVAALDGAAVYLELDLSLTGCEVVFQDIVRRSPTLSHVTIVTAWTCSRMRPDGFGGAVTVITADQVLSSSTDEMECQLLDRAQFGELGCTPGHGNHVLLRLSEDEVRGTVGELFDTEAPEGLSIDEVTDADIREACLLTVEYTNLSHEAGDAIFRSATRALTLAAERKQAAR